MYSIQIFNLKDVDGSDENCQPFYFVNRRMICAIIGASIGPAIVTWCILERMDVHPSD